MLSSPSQRVPMRVFPLINGCCQGARRVINSARPHTFQLIVEGKSLLLAAPNEYVASEWLQELVHAASGVGYLYFAIYFVCNGLIRNYHSFWVDYIFFCVIFQMYNTYKEKNQTQSCSLLMTSEHVLTVRETFPNILNNVLTSCNQHEPIKETQALSCASIVDLTSFRLPSAEQSWCILVSVSR